MKMVTSCLVVFLLIGCEAKDNLISLSPSSIVDRDELVEKYQLIHDFNSGEEFDTEKLKEIQNESKRKDYKIVLSEFFTQHLQKEIESFQTINKDDNGRHILVITKDRWLYKVSIKQWPEFNNIWTVDMYGGYLQSE
ncbi:hypothetical protein [Brevibacillus sp. NRS-1366]|uniref:hypothetical protein n=1 Tax=Brevibacillus sp. NRS-1366 TaxID=3233899 RepID=UPI003D1DA6A9